MRGVMLRARFVVYIYGYGYSENGIGSGVARCRALFGFFADQVFAVPFDDGRGGVCDRSRSRRLAD